MAAPLTNVSKWPERAMSLDRAWLATAAIVIALALAAPGQARLSLLFVGEALLTVAPFLLGSIILAGYSTASGADRLIARAFQGHPVTMILLAAAVGALSPFCSCGVIPLVAGLLAAGVPLAPVMAFWLASPLMDPSMFVITAGTLGLEFAIAKTLAAIAIGLLGGFGVRALMRAGLFEAPLRPALANPGCGAGAAARNFGPVAWRFWHAEESRRKFAVAVRDSVLFLGKWLVLAFLLESLMVAYLPAAMVARFVGDGGVLSVLGAALVGVPAYLNGYAALPLVDGLMGQGMAPGAAMAFLIAGGITSIPASIAVYAIARPPVFAAYIGFALTGAVVAGLAFGAL
ncbi:MAG: permease [Alphaproteobacteria bacterium]|nr:permease [Alphaproteobacteria bacterium]